MPGRAIRWAYVAAVVVFLASLVQYYQRNTGFTTLISFGDQFENTRLPAVVDVPHFVHSRSPGYDGQCYAQLAVEPLLRNRRLDRALDSPSYRARRILFSWTAYALGLGRPAWILGLRRCRTSSRGCCWPGSCCAGCRRPRPATSAVDRVPLRRSD